MLTAKQKAPCPAVAKCIRAPRGMPLGLEGGAPECHSGPTAATHQHPGQYMPRGYQ